MRKRVSCKELRAATLNILPLSLIAGVSFISLVREFHNGFGIFFGMLMCLIAPLEIWGCGMILSMINLNRPFTRNLGAMLWGILLSYTFLFLPFGLHLAFYIPLALIVQGVYYKCIEFTSSKFKSIQRFLPRRNIPIVSRLFWRLFGYILIIAAIYMGFLSLFTDIESSEDVTTYLIGAPMMAYIFTSPAWLASIALYSLGINRYFLRSRMTKIILLISCILASAAGFFYGGMHSVIVICTIVPTAFLIIQGVAIKINKVVRKDG